MSGTIMVSYKAKFPSATLEVINPEHLLQKLVDKITDTKTYAENPPYQAAIELTEEDCADLKISVDKDYLFSGLKIGYEKKEYENTNGLFEFNGQHDYATDYTGNAMDTD
jgi:predicted S18 family serine protease